MLRSNMPKAEIILWSKLKGKQLNGLKFRRQYSVEKFIIDFYCPQVKLAIEIDGDSHYAERAEIRDEERQKIIESYGINVLRFTNQHIYENVDGVVIRIMEKVEELTSPTPP